MSRSQMLYQLQGLDDQLDEANKQLAEIRAALGESQALKQAKKAVETAEQALRRARATMQDLDLEVKDLSDKIAREEKALYSGKLSSAKEAASLQDEVASLKRWQEKREELLLEAMVAVEEAEDRLEQAQTELSTIQARWAADQEVLAQKQSVLEAKVAELTEQRPTMAQLINKDDLNEYEELRPRKAGRAVVLVKNGVCQGCGMAASHSKVQRVRTGAELAYCSTCGRILHVV